MVLAEEDYADKDDSPLLILIKATKWDAVIAMLDTPAGREMVAHPDIFDNLPLHAAIGYQAPDDLILQILYMHPDAARVHGTDEWLPLHIASMWGVSARVLEALIRAYPQGLDDVGEGGVKGRTPRHFALRFPHNKELLERSTEEWNRIVQAESRKGDFGPWGMNKRMKAC